MNEIHKLSPIYFQMRCCFIFQDVDQGGVNVRQAVRQLSTDDEVSRGRTYGRTDVEVPSRLKSYLEGLLHLNTKRSEGKDKVIYSIKFLLLIVTRDTVNMPFRDIFHQLLLISQRSDFCFSEE